MTVCDAHFHIVQCNTCAQINNVSFVKACTCAHSIEEFYKQQSLVNSCQGKGNIQLFTSFGIHPQLCAEKPLPAIKEYSAFMKQLLEEKHINAIGEAGFDLYNESYRAGREWQEEAWKTQLELATVYEVPLIVHDRKALDELFRDALELSKIKAVVFHSFAFGVKEAQSLLHHHIHAYFSFNKQILNGNKKSISCVSELPSECILLETDAPFQTLKGESETKPNDIMTVYKAAAKIRGIEEEEIAAFIEKNFDAVFK